MTSWEDVLAARERTREAQQELEEFQAHMSAKSSSSSEPEDGMMIAWEDLLKQRVRTREAEQERDEFLARMEPKRERLRHQGDFALKMALASMFLSMVALGVAAILG